MGPECLIDLAYEELQHAIKRIGNTPMHPIYLKIAGKLRKVYLKLEGANPSGSIKDRTAYFLIQNLEQRHLLRKGSIIIESTSGNLGVAMSMICKARAYPLHIVTDPKTTQENIALMKALGTDVDVVDQPDATGGYLLSRLTRIRELCRRSNSYVWSNQYGNAANPNAHFLQTGREVYEQVDGQIEAVFVAVSTGGTLAGVSRYFRLRSPQTRMVAVDACGSVIFGTPPGPRKLTGIGSSRPSDFLTPADYDEYLLVRDEEAFALCRALSSTVGIKVGGSSGAVLSACARYLESHPLCSTVVCICADTGEKYASSIFCDDWLESNHLHITQKHVYPVQDIVEVLESVS